MFSLSLSLLLFEQTPRSEVVMVVTRSESMPSEGLNKSMRQSLGSMSSLNEKISSATDMNNRKNYHKSSRSLDLDAVSNEGNIGQINGVWKMGQLICF